MNLQRQYRLVSLGIGLSVAYWLLEMLFHVDILERGTFFSQLWPDDLNELWMRMTTVLIILCFAGYAQSIIQHRKVLLLKVTETEQRHRRLIDAIPFAILVLNEGDCIFANPAAITLIASGHPENILGRKFIDFVYATYKPRIHDKLTTTDPRGTLNSNLAIRLVCSDGSMLDAELTIVDIVFGDRQQIQVTIRDITEQRQSLAALQESEQRYRSLLQSAADGIITVNHAQKIMDWNRSAADSFGYQANEILGKNITTIIPTRLHSEFTSALAGVAAAEHNSALRSPLEFLGLTKNGVEFPIECTASCWQTRKQTYLTIMVRDISARKAFAEQSRIFSKVVAEAHNGVTVLDAERRIQIVNQAFTHITGYTIDEVKGKNPRILKSGQHDDAFYQSMWAEINEHGHWQGEIVNRRKSGELYAEWLHINIIRNSKGEIEYYVGIFTDITELKRMKDRLEYLSYTDILTGLPNRLLLNDRLMQQIRETERHRHRMAVMFIDLDRFKLINDSLGHGSGDELLRHISERLTKCVRSNDTVARLGGDEFIIVISDIERSNDAAAVARKILRALKSPISLNERDIHISPSIGISMYPGDGKDPDVLLKHADTAMYRAKNSGGNQYKFFRTTMNSQSLKRLQIENELHKALDHGDLLVYYQPKVLLESNTVTGFEALVRWQHADLGLISPDDFIPLAEETGLITAIGERVLTIACADMRTWLQHNLDIGHIAVNLSARQFRQRSLLRMVTSILRNTGLNPQHLELEITETTAMDKAIESSAVSNRLQKLGIRIAIDDFGTGYSSLAYLKNFPVTTLKIDRSFVKNIVNNEDDKAIIQTIIKLGRSLNLEVVAEGVETVAQRDLLNQYGCQLAQGFLYSPAVCFDEATELLRGDLAGSTNEYATLAE